MDRVALTGKPRYAADRSAPEPLLTVAQCCELLQVSKQTLYRLINSGELEPVRIGRHPRFVPADISAFIERNRETERAPETARGSRGNRSTRCSDRIRASRREKGGPA
jgi:excisionase family DNA binding protein